MPTNEHIAGVKEERRKEEEKKKKKKEHNREIDSFQC